MNAHGESHDACIGSARGAVAPAVAGDAADRRGGAPSRPRGSAQQSGPPATSAPADDDIWRPLVDGQPQAVSLLYERYGALAYTLAYRVLLDRHAAEDVVQEAFLSVWRNARTYSAARGSLRSWLCAIVRNRAIDGRRGRAGRPRLDRPLEEAAQHAGGIDVCGEVIGILDADRVRASMAALSAVERQTLELAYYGGCTQSEIARLMCVPLGTVKGRTRTGLGKLREALIDSR